jgi:trimeric autotransporter adhesin
MTYKHLAIATSLLSGLLVAGCGDSDSGIPFGGNTGNTPNNPITAPTAGNIAFSVLGSSSTTATAANGILSVGNPNTATVVNVQSPTTRGGTITANADGSFTYNAPALGNTTDTFMYTIQNAGGNSTGTATVTLLGRGFFVNNQAAAGGTGTQQQPFQTLAQVQAAANGVSGAEIVIFQGDGTANGYDTPYTLSNNQVLRGFSAAAQPTLRGPITLASGDKIQDLKFQNAQGDAIVGNFINNATIQGVTATNCGLSAMIVNNCTGVISVNGCSVQSTGSSAFAFGNEQGNLTWSVRNSLMDDNTACAISQISTGNSSQNCTINNCTFTNPKTNACGISLLPQLQGNCGYTITNSSLDGGNRATSGFDIEATGNSTTVGIVSTCSVTKVNGVGFQFFGTDNSSNRLKIDSLRSIANVFQISTQLAVGGQARLCTLLNGCTADTYVFQNIGMTSVLQVEEFSTLLSRNIGSLTLVGNPQDVPKGTCGL